MPRLDSLLQDSQGRRVRAHGFGVRGSFVRGALLIGVIVLGISACNRLTFIKPKLGRKGTEQVGQEYHFKDTKAQGNDRLALGRVQSAQSSLSTGDVTKARSELKEALKLDPKSAEAYSLMAQLADAEGKPAEAGGYYRKAAEFAPNRGATLNNYGVWLCGNQRGAEGLGYFDRALTDPQYQAPAVVLANSGACADKVGQGERADRDLRLALTVDPKNSMALGAMAKRQLRLGNAFEARAFSERRLAVGPISAEALMTASQIEEKLGDRAAAARYVQRMRAEFPDAQGSESGDGGK